MLAVTATMLLISVQGHRGTAGERERYGQALQARCATFGGRAGWCVAPFRGRKLSVDEGGSGVYHARASVHIQGAAEREAPSSGKLDAFNGNSRGAMGPQRCTP